jgi:hypothetical protein
MTTMHKFQASDGLRLSYAADDYTDPWRESDTLVMVHAAMGNARRFYAWVPHLARDFRVVGLERLDRPRFSATAVRRVVQVDGRCGYGQYHLQGRDARAV